MKTSHLFWGTIFFSLGIFLLLNNFFDFSVDFDLLWKIAPLFLVFIGVSMFVKSNVAKYILVVFSALLLSLTIFSAFNSVGKIFDNKLKFDFNSDSTVVADSSLYTYEYNENIKEAQFFFKGGAGRFRVDSTSDNLIEANTFSVKNLHIMKVETFNSTARIEFGMKDTSLNFGNKYRNNVDFSFNENPVWKLNFQCGAASMNFNLEEYKVESVNIEMGAAELNLKIGNKYPNTKVSIDAGASSIKLKIPSSSGCEIIADAILSSKNFKGFKKVESNKFRTDNFDNAENKIFIELNCGVSSINIEREGE